MPSRAVRLAALLSLLFAFGALAPAAVGADRYVALGDSFSSGVGTGSYTLIDGSSMRLPGTGAYTVEGENLERAGRKPDINVDTNIEELDQGIDQQTEAAVKTLLEQLGKKK